MRAFEIVFVCSTNKTHPPTIYLTICAIIIQKIFIHFKLRKKYSFLIHHYSLYSKFTILAEMPSFSNLVSQ